MSYNTLREYFEENYLKTLDNPLYMIEKPSSLQFRHPPMDSEVKLEDEVKEGCIVVHAIPFTLQGDYVSNSIIGRANTNYIENNFIDSSETTGVYIGIGSMGSSEVFMDIDVSNENLSDILDTLYRGDYPVIDDEYVTEVENAAQDDAWVDWVQSDFLHAISKKFPCFNNEHFTDNGIKHLELFLLGQERANEYWSFQDGTAYINIKAIVAKLQPIDILMIIDFDEHVVS